MKPWNGLKKNINSLLLIGALLVNGQFVWAAGTAGSAAPYLRNGIGARSLAMGNAATATTEDASVVYWNPAAITSLPVANLTAQTSVMGWQRSMNYLSYAFPIHKPSGNDFGFAVSWLSFSAGYDLEMRSNNYPEPEAIFRDDQSVLTAALASELGSPLSFGVTFKLLSHQLEEQKASGMGMDFGVWQQVTDEISWGAVVQDLFSSLKWGSGYIDAIPIMSRVGVEADLLNDYLVLAGDLSLTTGADTEFGYHVGAEYWFVDTAGIRLGINQGQLTTGIGWSFTIPDFVRMRLDYAFALEQVTTAGYTHFFSLVVDFLSKPKQMVK